MPPLRFLLPLLLTLLVGGCVNPPPPSYLTIDRSSAAFQAALAREVQRLTNEGKTVKQAEEIALKLVTDQFTAQAERQRAKDVTPLVRALRATEKKRGCWTYVATTTTRVADKTTSVVVERFDASQSEDQLWTLVSRDGVAPDEKAQAAYRKTRVRAWKKSVTNPEEPESAQAIEAAMNGELAIASDPATHRTTFTVGIGPAKIFLVANMQGYQKIYTLDETGRLLTRTEKTLGTIGAFAGTTKIDHFESVTDYGTIDPDLPPFVVRTYQRVRGRLFGVDSGEQEEEVVYSAYRRVTCHDDRFQVLVGPAQMMEFHPATGAGK